MAVRWHAPATWPGRAGKSGVWWRLTGSTKKGATGDPPATPYGPHPHGVDEAAGGADSSPHENEPTGERKDAADENAREGRKPKPGGE